MNKLFTKIAGAALGLTMAVGVGVAVSANNSEVMPVDAATNYQWQKMTSTSEFVDGTTILITQSSYYLNVSATSTSQTPRLANLTLSGGLPTLTADNTECLTVSGSGDSIKLVKASNNANWLITGSSNNAARINTGTTGNYWHIESGSTTGTFRLYSNSSTRYLSRYQTTDFRSYTGSADTSTAFKQLTIFKLVEAKTTQTITVDPASKEAYTDETISLTTNATTATWSLSSNTCGASLSANTGKNVSVSATSAGSVKVTAAATSTYTEASVTLTFSERPTTPFITPEKSSTSGYTGMDETISVSYGNLTSGLAVSSNDTSVVDASIDYDDEDGNADILLEFNGAGSTTVSLKDGSTQLETISVSVNASNVTITGLPSTGKAFIGNTLDLGATITVTATGSMSNSVTWSSGTTSVATVSSTGVVTGIKEGTSVITVTSVSKPSVSMSCTVSVEEQAVYTLVTDPSTLADGTQFVLVDYVSSTYRIAKDLNSGHIKMNTVTSATTISGTTSGSTVVTEEADVFTLVGSSGAWEIMRGDTYLQFTGTSNGNDSFTSTSSADTKFSIVASGTTNKLTINSNSRSNRALRYNTSTGDLRNYVNTGSQPDLYMFAIIPAQNELDHVTTSGQTTSFTAGNTFSYGGTLTAYYTIDDPLTKTPTSFKLDSESGTTITTSTVLTKAAHDGHEIYVLYTEDDITKSAHYTITVGYAAVTSVVINQHAAEIGLEELYDGYKSVGVTVNSQYADQGYEWIVSANTVDDKYLFDESGLLSGDTEGTITLRCRSTADNSKYDELVVTVTGNPTADFTPASVSGYVGKSDDIAFTYGNMSDTSLISITSSNSSIAEVDEFVADEGEGLVTVNFVAAGSATLSISYNGGSALDTLEVTVSTDSVTALTWSAPTIKVYSGASTTVSDASSWNVHYTMASGDYGSLVYGEYTLKLGGSSITLPHTWDTSEDGKVLSIEYGGFASPTTTTVDVTQTLQAVNADIQGEPVVSDLTFSAACGGSGTADDGASWTITSDGTESNWISGAGIHYGTNSASVTYIQLDNSDIAPTNGNKTITKIEVNARDAQANATLSVTVGGNAFGTSKSLTNTSTAYTFEGSAKGAIQVKSERTESMKKALYVLFVKVTYVTSSGTANIANVAGHEAAQKAVVAFAKAMNAAFDDTANCTEDVADAWSTASAAYASNITNNASLSADEKAYANNLIKYATAQYTDNTDEDFSYCLERAMATYESCIQKHGQKGFIGARPVSSSARISPISVVKNSGTTTAIIVVTSMLGLGAVGGYFFLRKRKEI